MAEALGIAASVVTITNCTLKIFQLAKAIKGAPDLLKDFEAVLTGVQLSNKTIAHVIKTLKPISESGLDEEVESRLSEAATNLNLFAETIEKKLKAFETIGKRIKRRVGKMFSDWEYITKYLKSANLVLTADAIKDLIKAAKEIEGSISLALICVLTIQNNRQCISLSGVHKEMAAHSAAFDKLLDHLRRNDRQTGVFEPPTAQDSISGEIRPSQEVSCSPPWANGEGEVQMVIARTTTQETQSISDEELQLTIAGGTRDTSADVPNENNPAQNEDLAALVCGELNRHLMRPQMSLIEASTTHSGQSTPTRSQQDLDSNDPSDTEDFAHTVSFSLSFASPRPTSPYTDGEEMELSSESRLSIYDWVDIERCRVPDQGLYRFCSRTLVLSEDGPPTFMLQEPCFFNGCQHVSIHLPSNRAAGDLDFSQCLDARLCNMSEDAPASANRPYQPTFKLALISGSGHSHTMVSHLKADRLEQRLALQADLSASNVREADANSSTGEGDTSDDRSDGQRRDTRNGGTRDAATETDQPIPSNRLGPYTSFPCCFCQEDALNPRKTGSRSPGFLSERKYLRVTCERCNNSTWMSATPYGPPLPIPYGPSFPMFGLLPALQLGYVAFFQQQ